MFLGVFVTFVPLAFLLVFLLLLMVSFAPIRITLLLDELHTQAPATFALPLLGLFMMLLFTLFAVFGLCCRGVTGLWVRAGGHIIGGLL